MARKQRERQKVTPRKVSSSARSTSKSVNVIISRSGRANKPRRRAVSVPLSSLPRRSSQARTKALHVKAAMARDPKLSRAQAAKAEGVSVRSIQRHLPSGFEKIGGRWRAVKSDRLHEIMYVPDAQGNPVPVHTKSRKQRVQVGNYVRDIGRFYRGKTTALAAWHGKRIAGVELVTSSRTLKSIEAQLSDFAIYSTFNGGAE
jgi:hypothetical protein